MFFKKKEVNPSISYTEFQDLKVKLKYVENIVEIQDTSIRRLRTLLGRHLSEHDTIEETNPNASEEMPDVQIEKKPKSINALDPVFL